MRDRCEGSLKAPTATETPIVKGKPLTLGSCPTCSAWIGVYRNGTLKPHVNWQLRNADRT